MPTTYMLPQSNRPREDRLSESDIRTLKAHFEAGNYEVIVDGQGIDWSKIDEIEVAPAARQRSPAGWCQRLSRPTRCWPRPRPSQPALPAILQAFSE